MSRWFLLGLFLCTAGGTAFGFIVDEEALILRRGDANNDGAVNASDASAINNYLFLDGPEPPCLNQADANNDGSVDLTDAIFILDWFFRGAATPPAPGPYNTRCAEDDEPYPGCKIDPCE